MVLADRWLVGVVVLGGVLAVVAATAVWLPAFVWLHPSPGLGLEGLEYAVVTAATYGAASLVLQLLAGVVVGAAIARAEGRPTSARESLGIAWRRRRQLLAWALVSSVIGMVARALERFGVGGLLTALTVDVGWAFATVFATPVIMTEGTMPRATVRRSVSLLRGRFTVVLLSSIGASLPWVVVLWFALSIGLVATVTAVLASGAVALAAAAVAVLCALVLGAALAMSSAVGATLQANLYRYAMGLPVPGVDRHLLPPLRPAP